MEATVMAGGRHRLGLPREAVWPRRWDTNRRGQAEDLDGEEKAWLVVYGPWSRLFWAFAAWPAPRPLVVDARTAEGLRQEMREAESLVLAGGWP
jgi:hypothetical protein